MCALRGTIRVRVCRSAQVCFAYVCLVLEPRIDVSFSIFFLFVCSTLLLLLPCIAVCITPCLKLSSSPLCGSHGTTAVLQKVCVDHFYACADIAYNTAPHAPCFLQHKLCLLYYLFVPFQIASPAGFHVTHIPKVNLVRVVGAQPYHDSSAEYV